jgi:uncharacterized membrane protein
MMIQNLIFMNGLIINMGIEQVFSNLKGVLPQTLAVAGAIFFYFFGQNDKAIMLIAVAIILHSIQHNR